MLIWPTVEKRGPGCRLRNLRKQSELKENSKPIILKSYIKEENSQPYWISVTNYKVGTKNCNGGSSMWLQRLKQSPLEAAEIARSTSLTWPAGEWDFFSESCVLKGVRKLFCLCKQVTAVYWCPYLALKNYLQR